MGYIFTILLMLGPKPLLNDIGIHYRLAPPHPPLEIPGAYPISMVYANAVELIFYSRKNFMSNGMKELKGFIVKKSLIPLCILESYSKGKVQNLDVKT